MIVPIEYNIITCLTKSCLHTFVETSFSLLRMTTVFPEMETFTARTNKSWAFSYLR